MRLENDNDEYGRSGIKFTTVILIASLAIFFVLAVVVAANSKKTPKHPTNTKPNTVTVSNEEEENLAEPVTGMTASDLDFWDMYKDNSIVPNSGEDYVASSKDDQPLSRKEELEKREEALFGEGEPDEEETEETEADAEKNPSEDGKHVKVVHSDGREEWLTINSSLKLNALDDMSFQSENGKIGYYSNNRKITKTGADISQYTGDITWKTLPSEVDYLMIRVGARGYDSGKIIEDTKFVNHVVDATKAGVPFGLYFSSQAISEDEAKEEVQFINNQINKAIMAVNSLNNNGSTSNGQNNTTNTQNNNSNVNNNNAPAYLTVNDYSRGIPNIASTVKTTTTDEEGNITSVYEDGTAVTRYINGDTVTAYSNGFLVNNRGDGTVEKRDGNGNVLLIDAKGNYTTKDINGNVIASGVSTNTSSVTTSNTTGNSNTQNNTNLNQQNTVVNNNGVNSTYYAFKVSYPIAVDVHMIPNDVARTDSISNVDRTAIVRAFCEGIRSLGYTPIILGDKEMLLTKLNLSPLASYGVWLNNEGTLPEYPYQMTMWKYDTNGTLIKSLGGDYGVSTCFVDFSAR